MPLPLEGRTIALAEGRQLEEMASMLEKEGAAVVRCPMVGIVDAPDAGPVVDWLRDLCAGRFACLVLMTGEALRRLLGFAERAGMRDAVVAALARTRTLTRGPKPVRALKEIGLAPTRIADSPTTEGVIASLREETLEGQAVGVTLFGAPNPVLEQFLKSKGAQPRTVLPYVYAPAADAEQVAGLIRRLARAPGQTPVAAVVFTSSPQVDRLFEVAAQRGLENELRQGLEATCVASIGPVVTQTLRQKGIDVDVCPEQGFVMKNLVKLIKRALEQPL